MNQYVKKFIPLAIAGLAATSAHAAINLGALSTAKEAPSVAVETFSSLSGASMFDFSLGIESTVHLDVFAPTVTLGGNTYSATGGFYQLFQNGTAIGSETAFGTATTFNGLSAGDYSLAWTAFKGSGAIAGVVNVAGFAAPVPEPETYAMLLAGLGMMGLIARRRSRQIH